jgi:hypothetical protein
MTHEEINQYIHEQIMGKCQHDFKFERIEQKWYGGGSRDGYNAELYKCRCGLEQYGPIFNTTRDYCSDQSPRRYLSEVIVKINNDQKITDTLSWMTSWGGSLVRASAEQIAEACVIVHKKMDER